MEKCREKRAYKRAMNHYGYRAQLQMLQEESAELIVAVSKILRKPDSNEPYRNLAEEMADVQIMCEQIQNHCTWMNLKQQVATAKHDKMLRLEKRLDEAGAK